MYAELGAPHNLPHFHVHYGEHMASLLIDPPALLVRSVAEATDASGIGVGGVAPGRT
jgi:hypothetical protein